jgi:hypothetical protein
MPSPSKISVAVALLAVGSALPTTHKGFVVYQVPKNPGFLTAGPHSVLKTYLKYGKEPPSAVEQAAASTTGSVAATPEEYDSEYLCPVTVGTPGVTLNMDFDTGSSDL